MNELFVVSFQRSGSNWLQRILASHPGVLINGELNPSAILARLNGLKTGDAVSNALMNELDAFHEGGRQLIRHLMRCNVGISFDDSRPQFLCDKTAFPLAASLRRHPDQFRYVAVLQEFFPDAKKILLIRDIRDVLVSHTEWKNPESRDYLGYRPLSIFYFMRGLRNWYTLHKKWLKDVEGDHNTLVIQYAELKQDFRQTVEKLFRFLALDVDSTFIENVCRNYYDIKSDSFQEENKKRGYDFFRAGREGDWQKKFSPLHKFIASSLYKSKISKLL